MAIRLTFNRWEPKQRSPVMQNLPSVRTTGIRLPRELLQRLSPLVRTTLPFRSSFTGIKHRKSLQKWDMGATGAKVPRDEKHHKQHAWESLEH